MNSNRIRNNKRHRPPTPMQQAQQQQPHNNNNNNKTNSSSSTTSDIQSKSTTKATPPQSTFKKMNQYCKRWNVNRPNPTECRTFRMNVGGGIVSLVLRN